MRYQVSSAIGSNQLIGGYVLPNSISKKYDQVARFRNEKCTASSFSMLGINLNSGRVLSKHSGQSTVCHATDSNDVCIEQEHTGNSKKRIKSESWEKTLRRYSDMQAEGVLLDEETLVSIVRTCVNARRLGNAIDFISSNKHKWDISGEILEKILDECILMMNSCNRRRKYKEAISIFEQMRELNLIDLNTDEDNKLSSFSIAAYTYAMKACEGLRAWRDAVELFNYFKVEASKMENNRVIAYDIGSIFKDENLLDTKVGEIYDKTDIDENAGMNEETILQIGAVSNELKVVKHHEVTGILAYIVFRTLYKSDEFCKALEYIPTALQCTQFRDRILCNMVMNCFIRNNQWSEAVGIFNLMSKEWNIEPDLMSFSLVINALSKAGMWKESIELFNQMIDLGIGAENNLGLTTVLNTTLGACYKANQCSYGEHVFKQAATLGIKFDTITYATIMNILATGGKCADAFAIFEESISNNMNPEILACNFILTKFAEHGAGSSAVQFMKAMQSINMLTTAVTYGAVISSLYRQGDSKRVIEMIKEMVGVYLLEPDRVTINEGITACRRIGNWQALAEMVQSVWQVNGVLEDDSLHRILGILGQSGKISLIKTILEDMEDRGMTITSRCYAALITSYCKQSRLNEALTTLRQLRSEGKSVDVAAYTSVIAGCRLVKDWSLAMKLFEEMMNAPESQNLRPNQFTYNAIIGVLTYSSQMQMAADMFGAMKQQGHSYDVLTYTNMILGFARAEQWREAIDIFYQLESFLEEIQIASMSKKHNIGGDEKADNVEVIYSTSTVPGDDATSIYPVKDWGKPRHLRLQRVGWPVYNEILRGCERLGEWKLALRLLKQMRVKTMNVDIVMYGAALGACSRAARWREALELLREMETGDPALDALAPPRPNIICYSAAITACERGGEWRKALHLLLCMVNAGLKPDISAYNAAISASAKCGEWQMALKLFASMRKSGLRPDVISIGSALLACYKGKRVDKAMELFSYSQRYGGPLLSIQSISILVELLDECKEYDKMVYVFDQAVAVGPEALDGSLDPSSSKVVDLHGYSLAVAKAAVRSGLRHLRQRYTLIGQDSGSSPHIIHDFVIITGVGKHSKHAYRPSIRPNVQAMLLEENPPLKAHLFPGNSGRLVVYKKDLLIWCSKQNMQRVPIPADEAGSLKLRSASDLERDFNSIWKANDKQI